MCRTYEFLLLSHSSCRDITSPSSNLSTIDEVTRRLRRLFGLPLQSCLVTSVGPVQVQVIDTVLDVLNECHY